MDEKGVGLLASVERKKDGMGGFTFLVKIPMCTEVSHIQKV